MPVTSIMQLLHAFFSTRGNIVRIDSCTEDSIRISLTVAIRLIGAPVNRYTPNDSAQLQVQTSPWNFKWCQSILDSICAKFDKFLAHEQAHMGQMGKWPWRCTTTGPDNSTELRMEKIHQAVTEIWVPQVWQPPARPPARTVTTIPLQPGGLRGKNWEGRQKILDKKIIVNHLILSRRPVKLPNTSEISLGV